MKFPRGLDNGLTLIFDIYTKILLCKLTVYLFIIHKRIYMYKYIWLKLFIDVP